MSEAKCTPGDWFYQKDDPTPARYPYFGIYAGSQRIASMTQHADKARPCTVLKSEEEAEANAKIMTAGKRLAGLLAETILYVEEAEQFHHAGARDLSKKIKKILAEIGHEI